MFHEFSVIPCICVLFAPKWQRQKTIYTFLTYCHGIFVLLYLQNFQYMLQLFNQSVSVQIFSTKDISMDANLAKIKMYGFVHRRETKNGASLIFKCDWSMAKQCYDWEIKIISVFVAPQHTNGNKLKAKNDQIFCYWKIMFILWRNRFMQHIMQKIRSIDTHTQKYRWLREYEHLFI